MYSLNSAPVHLHTPSALKWWGPDTASLCKYCSLNTVATKHFVLVQGYTCLTSCSSTVKKTSSFPWCVSGRRHKKMWVLNKNSDWKKEIVINTCMCRLMCNIVFFFSFYRFLCVWNTLLTGVLIVVLPDKHSTFEFGYLVSFLCGRGTGEVKKIQQ